MNNLFGRNHTDKITIIKRVIFVKEISCEECRNYESYKDIREGSSRSQFLLAV